MTQTKKMKMFMKLSEKEHLYDHDKQTAVGEETTTSPSELTQSIMKVISPLAKCTTAMRMLAYGVAADAVEKYIKIGGTTALECLRQFCKGILQLYE
uniref:Uncharacterized protein n=1 Tax=Brassica oleracea var. oleracea TaxID=109376 RepID=A0A0D3BHF5_BRAOL